jgi:hypothetical protein
MKEVIKFKEFERFKKTCKEEVELFISTGFLSIIINILLGRAVFENLLGSMVGFFLISIMFIGFAKLFYGIIFNFYDFIKFLLKKRRSIK